MPALPDDITVIFDSHRTQFNGLRMHVLRKDANVLLKLDFCLMSGNPSDSELEAQEIEQRKTTALVERLMKNPDFTLLEAAKVPDAQYFAADISDSERESSIFIESTSGKTPVRTMVDVVEALRKMGGKVKTVQAGGQSLRGGGATP